MAGQIVLDGKKARDFYKARLAEEAVRISHARGRAALLAIVQAGDDPSSAVYIEQKKKFGAAIGAAVEHIHLPASATFEQVRAAIAVLNMRTDVDGIIVQLPLPAHIDKLAVIGLIDPAKDVDGLTDENQRLLAEGKSRFIPATAKGVLSLLDFYGIDPKGMKATVMGRSRLVGLPTAELLRSRGAIVSVCHSQTPNPAEVARTAELLVVAIGKPHVVDESYIQPGAIIVDVGLTRTPEGLRGDVLPKALAAVSAYTPVPGGVGPMTVLSLFANLIASAQTRS